MEIWYCSWTSSRRTNNRTEKKKVVRTSVCPWSRNHLVASTCTGGDLVTSRNLRQGIASGIMYMSIAKLATQLINFYSLLISKMNWEQNNRHNLIFDCTEYKLFSTIQELCSIEIPFQYPFKNYCSVRTSSRNKWNKWHEIICFDCETILNINYMDGPKIKLDWLFR